MYDWLKSSYFQKDRPKTRPAYPDNMFLSLVEEITELIHPVKQVHTRALVQRYNKHFQDVSIFNMYATKPMVAEFSAL